VSAIARNPSSMFYVSMCLHKCQLTSANWGPAGYSGAASASVMTKNKR